jgi:hypothetical protein
MGWGYKSPNRSTVEHHHALIISRLLVSRTYTLLQIRVGEENFHLREARAYHPDISRSVFGMADDRRIFPSTVGA